eukprot:TRINITY_DN19154_c0_g1_i1.p1 TRINITY_DN19154_c0_g1~~TRINITY_DN19154_c0_g1_i1.p1  ORF type:complete len:447 (+),score=62.59 TRINITY_DN19154_c0_g1_i1:31-1341(+)
MVVVELIKASGSAVGSAIILSAVGVYCGRYPKGSPLLSPDLRKGMGNLLLKVLVPPLAFYSIAQGTSWEGLAEMWPVFIWCIVNLALSALASAVVSHILRLDGAFKVVFMAAGTFGNNVSLPLILLQTMCQEDSILELIPKKDDVAATPAECKSLTFGLVLLYGVPWRLCLFGIALPLMRRCASSPEGGSTTDEEGADIECQSIHSEENPNGSPTTIECNKPVEDENALLETLTQTSQPPQLPADEDPPYFSWNTFKAVAMDLNIIACLAGVVFGAVTPVKNFLIGDATNPPTMPMIGSALGALAEPSVTLAMLLLASALVPENATLGQYANRKVLYPSIGISISRFVITPALGFGIVYLAQRFVGMPGSRIQWLVILMQFTVPSSNLVVVSMSALGRHKIASDMAAVYAVQYGLCIIAVTAWTVAALVMVNAMPE